MPYIVFELSIYYTREVRLGCFLGVGGALAWKNRGQEARPHKENMATEMGDKKIEREREREHTHNGLQGLKGMKNECVIMACDRTKAPKASTSWRHVNPLHVKVHF